MFDLIIVGKGPAGLSAAIYAVRAGLSVLVLGRDYGALQKAEKIENYLGFPEPISGIELLKQSESQARRLGVKIIEEEVTGISWLEKFEIHTSVSKYNSIAVILATGIPRRKATIKNLAEYEGKGISYCATCDGFFYRGKTAAVIGNGEYALKEASELKPFAEKIILITNGREFDGQFSDDKIELDKRKIKNIFGSDEKLEGLDLEDGSKLKVDGIFIAEGTASALDLALKLGLNNDGKVIITNSDQSTNLPGIYAAGDCTGGLLQVAVAVGEGAKAGMSAAGYVKKSKGEKMPKMQW